MEMLVLFSQGDQEICCLDELVFNWPEGWEGHINDIIILA